MARLFSAKPSAVCQLALCQPSAAAATRRRTRVASLRTTRGASASCCRVSTCT